MTPNDIELARRMDRVRARSHGCCGERELIALLGAREGKNTWRQLVAKGWVCPHSAMPTSLGLRRLDEARVALPPPAVRALPPSLLDRVVALMSDGRARTAGDVAQALKTTEPRAEDVLRSARDAGWLVSDKPSCGGAGLVYEAAPVMEAAE